jgi:ketosteroid isomerase-like protein
MMTRHGLKHGKRGAPWGALSLAGMLAGCASVSATPPEIEAVERARFAAMTRQDVAALDSMLTPDVLYCHSNGMCEDKGQFLATIRGGNIRYKDIRVEKIHARPAAGTYILNGTITVDGEQNGTPMTLRIVYTDVYVKRDGRWQLAAWQSTRIP